MLVSLLMASLSAANRVYVPSPSNMSNRPVIWRRLQRVKKSVLLGAHTVCAMVCGAGAGATVGGDVTGVSSVGGGVLGGRVASTGAGVVLGGRVACRSRKLMVVFFF